MPLATIRVIAAADDPVAAPDLIAVGARVADRRSSSGAAVLHCFERPVGGESERLTARTDLAHRVRSRGGPGGRSRPPDSLTPADVGAIIQRRRPHGLWREC